MACTECERARISAYRLFNPTCLWCGARLIQRIQGMPITPSSKSARCKQVLTDWMAYGHSEQLLRQLAKQSTPPLEPIEVANDKSATKSANQKKVLK